MNLKSFIRRKILRIGRDRWNHQYERGLWDGLAGLDELARFSVVAGYVRFLKPARPALLEIGCGTGLFQQRLRPGDYGRFVGVDVSDTAIEQARAEAIETCTYAVADMDKFTPDGSFDLLIFNEVLYYSRQPLQTLQRLATHLNPDGLLIVTVNDHKHSDALWAELLTGFRVVDETVVANAKGRWVCRVLA
jgi:predicted TPR repeat methyltransferase